jgi:hypothetical protein
VVWAAWHRVKGSGRGDSSSVDVPDATRGVGGRPNRGKGGFPRRRLIGEEENRGGDTGSMAWHKRKGRAAPGGVREG